MRRSNSFTHEPLWVVTHTAWPASKMEDDAVPTIEELKKLKVVDLKARLASLGLQTSGSFD